MTLITVLIDVFDCYNVLKRYGIFIEWNHETTYAYSLKEHNNSLCKS